MAAKGDDAKTAPAGDIDSYIASVPEAARLLLTEIRRLVVQAAPQAVESISYGMPTFKVAGRPLVYLAAAKKHCSLHAITRPVMAAFRAELLGYETSEGGTVRFPLGKPAPAELVTKLVQARLAEMRPAKDR